MVPEQQHVGAQSGIAAQARQLVDAGRKRLVAHVAFERDVLAHVVDVEHRGGQRFVRVNILHINMFLRLSRQVDAHIVCLGRDQHLIIVKYLSEENAGIP